MNKKPIGPAAHGALDYSFVAMQLLAPRVLGFRGAAQALCLSFGATTAILNGLTDQPVAIKKVIPLRFHGAFGGPFLITLLLLPWLTGALKEKTSRLYFVTFFAMALTNYLLTYYNADQPAELPEASS